MSNTTMSLKFGTRRSIYWLCLALTVTLSCGGPLTNEPCGPPETQRKMVFSARAFHHDFSQSDIQCFDLCWSVISCHAASYNTETKLCRLFNVNDVSTATFVDSDLELYTVMTRAVCKPFDDPCIKRQCGEGTQCQPTDDEHNICIGLDAKPIEGTCPVVQMPSEVRVSYIGNTPGASATVNCPVNMAYTGSENITCMDSASWDQPPGRCVFFVWNNPPVPWQHTISGGSLVHGRCLEVLGHTHPPNWFELSLQARSSQSCVLRLQARGGTWTINSRFGKNNWGKPERSTKKQPFKPLGPLNLTICFGETFKLYGQGDLFATYRQRMNPDSITLIDLKDLDLNQVIIRAANDITSDASGNVAGTAKDTVKEHWGGARLIKRRSSSEKPRTGGRSLGKLRSKEEMASSQDSLDGKERERDATLQKTDDDNDGPHEASDMLYDDIVG